MKKNNNFKCYFCTINVVNLEQEFYLVVRTFPCKLVHSIDELLKRYGSRIILVENLEHSVGEERLRK